MGDITRRITRKSLKAKRKAAIKTIKVQTKEKIHKIKVDYSMDAEKKKERALEKENKRELRAQKANARQAYNARQPRPFTLGEDLLSSISNGIAAGLSVAAIVLLIVKAYFHAPVAQKSAYISTFAIFGSCLFIMHLMSTLYHAISATGSRKFFSIMSHCAVYLLIASLYSTLILTRNNVSSSIAGCVVVCGICTVLIVLYATLSNKLYSFSVLTYILFGIILFSLVFSGTLTIPKTSSTLLFFSAISFVLALAFFLMRKFKWAHGIFHLFSQCGAVFIFFSLYYLI